jgi:hypothetical protein
MKTLVQAIREVLEQERWFPRVWEPAKEGEAINEHGVIERVGPLWYIYRKQRHHPIMPWVLAEQTQRVFLTAGGAARCYLRWDLNLPGRLDGYEVVR